MDEIQAKATWLKEARIERGWSAAEIARRVIERAELQGERLTLSQQAISNFENGQTKSVPRWVAVAEQVLTPQDTQNLSPQRRLAEDLVGKATPKQLLIIRDLIAGIATPADVAAENLDLVAIGEINLAYGMGLTFTDDPVEVTVRHFPRVWIESISSAPPNLLTISRGRGDSMEPTIKDGDMIIINRAERRILEQDALWALTMGDLGMIKRVRVKGERVILLSDNDRVPPDEVHIKEINVVGRIDFVGSRK